MTDDTLVILMPVFNDWPACRRVLSDLDAALAERGLAAAVLLVDDASTAPMPEQLARQAFGALSRLDVLRLKRNLGHQRAICIGLAHIAANLPCRAVVVMDSDGEDDPRDVPKLLDKCLRECNGEKIVFAERARRSESWCFRAGYLLFRVFHRLLTGRRIRFGNFSVIPRPHLESLVTVSEMWSHYAAAVVCSRQPFCGIPTCRADRADGKSKMNFVALVIHGLSAMSVFSDVVGVRVGIAAALLAVLSMLGIGSVVAVRLLTNLAAPGWATFTAGTLLVVLLQAIMFAAFFSFVILSGRKAVSFMPCRDYIPFVGAVTNIYRTPHPGPVVLGPYGFASPRSTMSVLKP